MIMKMIVTKKIVTVFQSENDAEKFAAMLKIAGAEIIIEKYK